jgi:hypothetical protein
MAIKNSQKLQNAQTTISTGDYINVTETDVMVISISGTSTSFTILFQASLDGVNYFNISGTKLSDPTVFSTTTSTIGEAWEFDVSAITSVKTNLTAIGNGNITVVANIPFMH